MARAEFGTTLQLTTHHQSDIERRCERVLVVDRGRLAFDGTLAGLAARVALQRVLVVDLPEPGPDLNVAAAIHIGSELGGQRQRLAFSPQRTTAARVLAEVTAKTEVIDLTLEEPAIEDIVRTLDGRPMSLWGARFRSGGRARGWSPPGDRCGRRTSARSLRRSRRARP